MLNSFRVSRRLRPNAISARMRLQRIALQHFFTRRPLRGCVCKCECTCALMCRYLLATHHQRTSSPNGHWRRLIYRRQSPVDFKRRRTHTNTPPQTLKHTEKHHLARLVESAITPTYTVPPSIRAPHQDYVRPNFIHIHRPIDGPINILLNVSVLLR